MPSLLELQRGFRTAVLTGAAMPISIIGGGKVGAVERLGVYRNNVFGNLTRALRLSYPAVERLVGEDFFAAVAQRFIEAAPPHTADLNQYGEGLAEFLACLEPAASVPYLPDVARLEWAVNCALHAPPAARLLPAELAAVPPECEANLFFQAHPSLSLLALGYPAHVIWQTVLNDDTDERDARLGSIELDVDGETLAVLCADGALEVEALTGSAFELAQSLAAGRPLGDALQCVPAKDAAPMLANFLARGFFAGFTLSAKDATNTQGTPS